MVGEVIIGDNDLSISGFLESWKQTVLEWSGILVVSMGTGGP